MGLANVNRRLIAAGLLSVTLMLGSVLGYRAYSPRPEANRAINGGMETTPGVLVSISAGPSTSLVAMRIRNDIPDYDTLSDFERVSAIRQWVYAQVDLAASSTLLVDEAAYPLHLGTVDENFQRVFDDNGGYWCGGTAYLASQVYQAMGFPAVTYDCGNSLLLTHVVALVQVEGRWYAEDAYFNLSYVDDTGQPLPFLDLLRQLGTGHVPQSRQGKRINKDVHWTAEIPPGRAQRFDWSLGIDGPAALKRKLNDTHYVYRAHPTLEDFLAFLPTDSPILAWLESERLPRTLTSLLMFPLGMNDQGRYFTNPAQHPLFDAIATTIAEARSSDVPADPPVRNIDTVPTPAGDGVRLNLFWMIPSPRTPLAMMN